MMAIFMSTATFSKDGIHTVSVTQPSLNSFCRNFVHSCIISSCSKFRKNYV